MYKELEFEDSKYGKSKQFFLEIFFHFWVKATVIKILLEIPVWAWDISNYFDYQNQWKLPAIGLKTTSKN